MEFQSRDLKKQSNKRNVYYRYMDIVRITYNFYLNLFIIIQIFPVNNFYLRITNKQEDGN